LRESEESSAAQLELARRQDKALRAALQAMDKESDSGVLTRKAGDYEVGLAVEEAEGMWEWRAGELNWRNPKSENCHIEVCVRDRADGRFIPDLDLTVTLLDAEGCELGIHWQPFLWHPWLYHYGRNWEVPQEGTYGVRVRVEPPTFMRHDHENERCYRERIDVEFDGLEIEPDRKRV
jgi:hypothetical protein